jgi:hypothetical protein
VLGLRVSEEEELVGLDASQHGERGYILDGGSGYSGIPVTTNGGGSSDHGGAPVQAPAATSEAIG